PRICARSLVIGHVFVSGEADQIRDQDHLGLPLLHGNRARPAQRDELPLCHSTTLSARVSKVGGISSPIVLAVLRLITSSYLVGVRTGRSEGLSPFRMLSM